MSTNRTTNAKALHIVVALAGLVLVSAASDLRAEVINLESGNKSQFSQGQQDTSITMWEGNDQIYPCYPLSPAAFTPANFSTAQGGPNPYVVNNPVGGGFWMPNASFSDPLAQWISFNASATDPGGAARNMLFAQQFTIVTAGITSATLNFSWAVDDSLGDSNFGGPNPLGVYINGNAVPGISGGLDSNETSVLTINIDPNWVNTGGNNYLYVYDRDTAADFSGVIYSAQLTINGNDNGTSPEPATLSLLALGGLAVIRRRR